MVLDTSAIIAAMAMENDELTAKTVLIGAIADTIRSRNLTRQARLMRSERLAALAGMGRRYVGEPTVFRSLTRSHRP
jgi:hypothetical protein